MSDKGGGSSTSRSAHEHAAAAVNQLFPGQQYAAAKVELVSMANGVAKEGAGANDERSTPLKGAVSSKLAAADVEAQHSGAAPIPQKFERNARLRPWGLAVLLFFLAAFIFYLVVRVSGSLDGLGGWQRSYGIYVLVVECLGATTVLSYAINLVWRVKEPEPAPCRQPYHIHVLIPCYREDVAIVEKTLRAANDAILPEGCHRTIYLCDDERGDTDNKRAKRALCAAVGALHVTERRRDPSQVNGKSANLNNALQNVAFPDPSQLASTDLVCIFDADQAAHPHFFQQTVSLFDGGEDVGMVLSPQVFHNTDTWADVLNFRNLDFWEYMQPGYDGLGFISCTGTNFLARASALASAGWFPEWTVTEDYALGMRLKAGGWQCRYVRWALAIGEAPRDTRSAFQQRSRWCKGHFQIIFSRHCPLLASGLSFGMRLMYCGPAWNYAINAITSLTLWGVPLVYLWLAAFPLVVSRTFALAATLYAVSMILVTYSVRSPRHILGLWFAATANTILWYTYAKAGLRAALFGHARFKDTRKGKAHWLSCTCCAAVRQDLYMPAIMIALTALSIFLAVWKSLNNPVWVLVRSPLAISLCWAVLNALPYLLLFIWSFGHSFGAPVVRLACIIAFLASAALAAAALGLTWVVTDSRFETSKQFSYCGALPIDLWKTIHIGRPKSLGICLGVGHHG